MSVNETNHSVIDRGSLPALLANRARLASDRRLVGDAAVGLVTAATAAILRPPLWVPLTALAFCLGAFGVWGILDREAADAAGPGRRALVIARNVVAVLGGAAAVAFGFTLFGELLGPIIS